MLKVDLHTHSVASPDGGIKPEEYAALLEAAQLDCIAITDHNTIDLAKKLHQNLGPHIIVGEEINTIEGELIGLFLQEHVAPGQSVLKTAQAIKSQGAIVYVPHPFETVRNGLPLSGLEVIADLVDIIEVRNGRALFQNGGPKATTWARLHHKVTAASSDAHGRKGLCTTYTLVSAIPTVETIVNELARARLIVNRPPLYTLLFPKYNRLRKKWSRA